MWYTLMSLHIKANDSIFKIVLIKIVYNLNRINKIFCKIFTLLHFIWKLIADEFIKYYILCYTFYVCATC